MCRHLTYIALNVTYLAHVSFSLLSPSSILSYSFTPLSLLLPPSLDESSRARSMCVEISGRVWGSIDFWSCEMTSLILYHRVYVWFVPGRKHQTSYSTCEDIFTLYRLCLENSFVCVCESVSGSPSWRTTELPGHIATNAETKEDDSWWHLAKEAPCGWNLSCLQMWPAAGVGRSQTDTRRWSKGVAMSVSPH